MVGAPVGNFVSLAVGLGDGFGLGDEAGLCDGFGLGDEAGWGVGWDGLPPQ